MSPVEVNTVLVPVDGSDESVTAVEYAVGIAERYDATVHVLYVLGEDAVRAIERGAVEEGDVADDTKAFLESATAVGDDHGVETSTSIAYGYSVHRKLRHPGSVILDCAEELDADFLVIPREPIADGESDVLEKAAEYVLLYASQPVLSV